MSIIRCINWRCIIFCFVFTNSFSQDGSSLVKPCLENIISKYPNVRDLAISPLGNEMYFSLQGYQGELSTILFVHLQKDSVYSEPIVAPFSGKYLDLEPSFSPDGLKLFFVSNRPLSPTSNEVKDYDIWYLERTNLTSDWSKPINMGAPINSSYNEFYPSITNSKNLYFTCDEGKTKGKDDIFVSKWVNGKYTEPESLSDSINSEGYEFNAFVSPDENYLIYTCYNRPLSSGSGDLYISYKLKSDDWSLAQNMGERINSAQMDYCPFVDSKGTFYFTSKRNELSKTFDSIKNIDQILAELNKFQNGLSRLYKVEKIDLKMKE